MTDESTVLPALRILQVNSLLNGGGTDDQCLKLAKGLAELGQHVWLAGPDSRPLSGSVRGLGVPLLPTGTGGPAKLGFLRSVAKCARRERVQVIHAHHGRDFWPAIVAGRISGMRPKVVLTRHLAKSPGSAVSRRFLLAHCDALIAVSHFVASVLRNGSSEPDSPIPERRSRPPLAGDLSKIVVIHNGIDTARFRPAPADAQREAWRLASENFAFGVVGAYDLPHGKGQRVFLEAAAAVHSSIPRARFLIIGRGTLKEVLLRDIARLGLEGKASLTPYAADPPTAFNAIDWLVHPQIGTEAFAGVILEAFACGRPVIASALDGIPEAFATGNLGQLVPPFSVTELAKALVHAAHATPLTWEQRLHLHNRLASRFSLEGTATTTLLLYRRLLGGAAPQ